MSLEESIGYQKESLTLAEWLSEGPFTLCFSAGFFGFFAHAGLLAGLTEAGFRPQRVSGSSAGALVAAVWASGYEMHDIKERLLSLERHEFWDPSLGLGLLKGKLFEKKFHQFLKVNSFKECRVPLTISVFDIFRLRTHVVKSGDINCAVRASCCLPGLFQPVFVDGRWAVDGGVMDMPGFAGIPREDRVLYHHLGNPASSSRKNRVFAGVPVRRNTIPITLRGLPTVTPFKLDQGAEAYGSARAQVKCLLASRVANDRGDWIMRSSGRPD